MENPIVYSPVDAGKIISDLIMQKENNYSTLFDPNREFNVNKLTSYLSYNL